MAKPHFVRIEKRLHKDSSPTFNAFCVDCVKRFPDRNTDVEAINDSLRHRDETR